MDLLNKSMPDHLRMNTLFLFSIQKRSTTVKDTSCHSFGLITMSVCRINFYLRIFKTLLQRLFKDSELHKRYAETKWEEIKNGHVVTVKSLDSRSRNHREW